MYYPTITKENGNSGAPGVKKLKSTYYNYNKSKVNQEIQNILWTGNDYWLASRCVDTASSSAYFFVRNVYGSGVHVNNLCYGYNSFLEGNPYRLYAVRPLVSLKSEVIDIDAGYDETTGWELK